MRHWLPLLPAAFACLLCGAPLLGADEAAAPTDERVDMWILHGDTLNGARQALAGQIRDAELKIPFQTDDDVSVLLEVTRDRSNGDKVVLIEVWSTSSKKSPSAHFVRQCRPGNPDFAALRDKLKME
jgi:hypothetical protein